LKSSLLTTRQRWLVDYGLRSFGAGFATFVDVDCSLVLGVGHYCVAARTSGLCTPGIVNDKSIPCAAAPEGIIKAGRHNCGFALKRSGSALGFHKRCADSTTADVDSAGDVL